MERGLIVIPKQIREEAGLTVNSYVRFERRNEEIIIRPVDTFSGLRILPAKLAKEQAIVLLTKMNGPIWTQVDYNFWKRGRAKALARQKKYESSY